MDKIMVLPGDGIGPEIIQQAVNILDFLNEHFGLEIDCQYGDVGGTSIDRYKVPLTEEVLSKCRESKAVLLGAVGGPRWESTEPGKPRPEDALMALRKELGLFANLRPVKVFKPLMSYSTLKQGVLKGVDVLVIRELTGGIYFGPRERLEENGHQKAYDTMAYADYEVERIARLAFRAAKTRKGIVTSIDKANILESSRLWRETVNSVARSYPDIKLNHMYVDNAAMQLVKNPGQFDVILASNVFGDILSDEAATISGSIGLLPSASLGSGRLGMYEPIHGSAPDIAGTGKANPLATILSLAMMFRYTFGNREISELIEKAVDLVLEKGYRTEDICKPGDSPVGTKRMGDLIMAEIKGNC